MLLAHCVVLILFWRELQTLPTISSKFSSLKAFLSTAGAADCLSLLNKEDVQLSQLPDITEDQLKGIGIKLGPANRIAKLAQQFSSG